jgi:hypothetical protein
VAPGLNTGEQHIAELAQQIDLVPTLTGLLGIRGKYRHQGRDLTLHENRSSRMVYLTWPPAHSLALVDQSWKYIWHVDQGNQELFNLGADPLEHHNIANMETERAAYYQRLVQRWSMYEQDYYKEQAVQDYKDQDLVAIPLSVERIRPGGPTASGRYIPVQDRRQLFSYKGTYAEGFSLRMYGAVELDLKNLDAKKLSVDFAPEYGHCEASTMPWEISVKKKGAAFFTAVITDCSEVHPITLDVGGVDELTIMLTCSTGSASPTLVNNQTLILGNPRLRGVLIPKYESSVH